MPLILVNVNENWIFFHKYQISWKSTQWKPSCSMRTDGRADMTKLIVAFRNFAVAPKRGKWRPLSVKWIVPYVAHFSAVWNMFQCATHTHHTHTHTPHTHTHTTHTHTHTYTHTTHTHIHTHTDIQPGSRRHFTGVLRRWIELRGKAFVRSSELVRNSAEDDVARNSRRAKEWESD